MDLSTYTVVIEERGRYFFCRTIPATCTFFTPKPRYEWRFFAEDGTAYTKAEAEQIAEHLRALGKTPAVISRVEAIAAARREAIAHANANQEAHGSGGKTHGS